MAVTDLTGTKWRFKKQGVVPFTEEAVNTIFNISGTCMGFNIDQIRAPYATSGAIILTVTLRLIESGSVSYIRTSDIIYASLGLSTGEGWYRLIDNTGTKISAPTIEITGGTDATNPEAIYFMQINAEQIIEETSNVYVGELPLNSAYIGTDEIKKIYVGESLVYEAEV